MTTSAVSRFDQFARWQTWEEVQPTGWEQIGDFRIDPTWHRRFHDALETAPNVQAELGDRVHPGILACWMLAELRFRFPIPSPAGGGLVLLHTTENLRLFEAPGVGETLRLVGRLATKDEARMTVLYEGWAMGDDGAPRALNSFELRFVKIAKAVQR